ncbi:MAG TPA: M23 family metallopeptidase [Novosphingobium sp.]|nr:M23 family metallopeptidase [Novosphingobium sp.]
MPLFANGDQPQLAFAGGAGTGGGPGRPAVPPPASLGALARQACDDARARIEQRLHAVDIAPDLAQDIGSRRWFRGLGTMMALSLLAVSFWPDMTAVEAATAMPVDAEVRDEFRSQMIMPLALGADSGRHMGATPAVLPLRSAPERPSLELTATLGAGDSFGRMLQRAGVGSGDAAHVIQMVSASVPLTDIEPGTRFDIVLGKRTSPEMPRPLDRVDFRARMDLDLSIARRDGGLTLQRQPIPVDATPLRIRGPVGGSLYRSARAAGAPLKAIQQYLQAIDDHVSLEGGIAATDRYDLIVAFRRSAKGERKVGELLYAGLEGNGQQRLALMRWGKDGQFFEASGVGQRQSATFAPVSGRITSSFGFRRHPILGYMRMHSGIDYAAHYGTPIRAVSDGMVTYAGRHGGHGNFVRLSHGGGLGTGYAHMSQIAVAPGASVRAGQVIGYVGSTGLSTGPHLHFEVYQGGRKLDPLSVRFVSRPQIDGAELAQFKQQLSRLKAVPAGAALRPIAPVAVREAQPTREIDKLAMRESPRRPS